MHKYFLNSLLINRKDTESNQWKAYNYFDAKNKRLSDEEIEVMFFNAIHKMSVMLVVIINEVNLGQVYLWLQEKSLFGEGALLHNPSPGEFLTGNLSNDNYTDHILRFFSKERHGGI